MVQQNAGRLSRVLTRIGLVLVLPITVVAATPAQADATGTEDTSFYASLTSTGDGTGFNQNVESLALQSDGGVIAAGDFTSLNGSPVGRLVRLASTGSEDGTFTSNLGSGFNGFVDDIAVQPDNKVVVAGEFSGLDGTPRNYLVRLDSDGTEDTAFYTNLTSTGDGAGFNRQIFSIAVQSDGKILVGGRFGTLNGIPRNYLVRLNADGTEDTAFYTNLTSTGDGAGFNDRILAMHVQSDGKILVGGRFTALNGTLRDRLVRLNADGTEDTAFYTNLTSTGDGTGFDSWVTDLALQSDGNILVGGGFTTFGGLARKFLVRLGSTGSEDSSFYTNLISSGDNTGLSTSPSALVVQSDDKILFGASPFRLNGQARAGLLRLNADGNEDTDFYTTLTASGNGAGYLFGGVYAAAVQSSGTIVTGGGFTTLNGVTRNRLLALEGGTGGGSSSTSGQPSYTFTFLTSGGGKCLPDVTVRRFEQFTLPPSSVACTPLGTAMAGWSIPGQDWAFAPGRVVTVVDSQVFTAVAREPHVSITYDANVGMDQQCTTDGVNTEQASDRSATIQTPREGANAQVATTAPCTPPGFALVGWTDANTPEGSGQAQQGASTYAPGSAIPEAWNLQGPNPINEVRLYALWERSTAEK